MAKSNSSWMRVSIVNSALYFRFPFDLFCSSHIYLYIFSAESLINSLEGQTKAIQCSTDRVDQIGTRFLFSEIERLVVPSELCDKVNIYFQMAVDWLTYRSCMSPAIWKLWQKKANAKFYKTCFHNERSVSTLHVYWQWVVCLFFKLNFYSHNGRRNI